MRRSRIIRLLSAALSRVATQVTAQPQSHHRLSESIPLVLCLSCDAGRRHGRPWSQGQEVAAGPAGPRVFAACHPGTDQAFALAQPEATAASRGAFRAAFAEQLAPGTHAVLLVDQAGRPGARR